MIRSQGGVGVEAPVRDYRDGVKQCFPRLVRKTEHKNLKGDPYALDNLKVSLP
jgi:hypothetical protein